MRYLIFLIMWNIPSVTIFVDIITGRVSILVRTIQGYHLDRHFSTVTFEGTNKTTATASAVYVAWKRTSFPLSRTDRTCKQAIFNIHSVIFKKWKRKTQRIDPAT